jgi:hypothetical protein
MAHVINSQTQLIRNVNDAFLRTLLGATRYSRPVNLAAFFLWARQRKGG